MEKWGNGQEMGECALVLVVVCILVLLGGTWSEAQENTNSQATVPVSAAHALFGKQCGLCHEPFKGAPEPLCLKCHDGPVHAAAQTVTPSCISCHIEHKGQTKLAPVANEQCVTCHKDLKVKNGALLFAKKVTDFAKDHPEFAVSQKSGDGMKRVRLNEAGGSQSDRTTLLFPHEVHLKPELKSPKGQVQLTCKDCHATAEDGKQIAPVAYEKHCQSCHQLVFLPKLLNRFAPHAEPSVIRDFLVASFAKRQVAAAQEYLYTVTCNKCHVVENPRARMPTIARVAIPRVWLPHALFSHRSHRLLECAACHDNVTKSKTAADTNLPSIRVCQECHRASGQTTAATVQQSATVECVSCHDYHDKTKDRDWLGNFTVQRLLTEGGGDKSAGQVKPEKK
jgi:hypothetical protein